MFRGWDGVESKEKALTRPRLNLFVVRPWCRCTVLRWSVCSALTVVTTLGHVSRCQRPSAALLTAAQRTHTHTVNRVCLSGAVANRGTISLPHIKALFVNVSPLPPPCPRHPTVPLPSPQYLEQVTISTMSAVKPPLSHDSPLIGCNLRAPVSCQSSRQRWL